MLDYREPALRDARPSHGEGERARVARALSEAPPAIHEDMGPTFAILGEGRGAFTAPGADEQIYLIQRKAPVAIDPFPNAPAPVLLVLGSQGPARFYRLAKADQFQRLAAAADAERDGRNEVLLESSFTNMGETVTALTAVRLDPAQGTAEAFQTIPDVVADRCEGPKKQRSLNAATISRDGTGAFTAQRQRLACELRFEGPHSMSGSSLRYCGALLSLAGEKVGLAQEAPPTPRTPDRKGLWDPYRLVVAHESCDRLPFQGERGPAPHATRIQDDPRSLSP